MVHFTMLGLRDVVCGSDRRSCLLALDVIASPSDGQNHVLAVRPLHWQALPVINALDPFQHMSSLTSRCNQRWDILKMLWFADLLQLMKGPSQRWTPGWS